MAKTIIYTDEDVQKYATLSDVLQLEALDIVGEEYNEETNTIILTCTHRFFVGVCPDCGCISDKIHDYPSERTIIDAPIRGCYVNLVFNCVRLTCDNCMKPFTLPVSDVVPDCTYTYRLAEMVADPALKQDINTLSEVYGIGYKTAESICFKAAQDKLERRENEPIEVIRLGIDEISNKKGQGGYVLVLTDLDRRILLDILPDRKKETLKDWLKNPPKGINLKSMEEAATDLWFHYKDTVLEVYPNVNVVADRYHVMDNMHKVIDQERRKAQANAKTEEERKQLKGLRYILLKDKSKLKDSDALALRGKKD